MVFYGNFQISYSSLWPQTDQANDDFLNKLDRGSGILQIWYVLLEGLCGATMVCSRRHQPQVLDTLFSLLRCLPDCPG